MSLLMILVVFFTGVVLMVQACEPNTDKASCDADSRCRWDNNNNNCVEACSIAYDSQGDCNEDDACIWLDSSNECGPNCFANYDNETSCDAASGCRWNATAGSGGECIENCESTYSDETSCDDDKLCRWAFKVDNCAGGICPFYHACEESCFVIHQDNETCNRDNMCRWLEDVGECTAACTQIVGDEMACNAAPGCEWYYREGRYSCWDECATKQDRSLCQGSGDCRWVDEKCT